MPETTEMSISTRSVTRKRRETGQPDGLVAPDVNGDEIDDSDDMTVTDDDDGDNQQQAVGGSVCTLSLL